MRGGGDQVQQLLAKAQTANGSRIVAAPVNAADTRELQALGDALREQLGSGVGVLAASFPEGKHAMLVVVTDDLRERGVRADAIVREVAAVAGGKGGGKAHMAQAGIPDGSRLAEALASAPELIRPVLPAKE
jgi:alanyl-tRNA synthetase